MSEDAFETQDHICYTHNDQFTVAILTVEAALDAYSVRKSAVKIKAHNPRKFTFVSYVSGNKSLRQILRRAPGQG